MSVERRRYRRICSRVLVLGSFGTYFTKDVSPGGVCISGPPEIKEKLNLNETIEFNLLTLHGDILLVSVGTHCIGKVMSINEPSPYLTEVGVSFHEVPVLN